MLRGPLSFWTYPETTDMRKERCTDLQNGTPMTYQAPNALQYPVVLRPPSAWRRLHLSLRARLLMPRGLLRRPLYWAWGTPAKSGRHRRDLNLKAYKVLSHQHGPEINAFLSGLSTVEPIRFVPLSAPIDRGILATVMLPMKRAWSLEEAQQTLTDKYETHPLVRVREVSPEIRHVRGTAFCDVATFVDGNDVVVVLPLTILEKAPAPRRCNA